jgi:hypothetical protein
VKWGTTMENTLTHTTEFEVAQNFVIHNYGKLISGEKIPPIKFRFNEDGYMIFETLKNFQFVIHILVK